MTDQLIREVEEEVRREQLQKLWDRYGIYVIGIAVLVVASVAGYRGWEAWQASRSASAGDSYLSAINAATDGETDEAAALLSEVEATGVGSYPSLARLRAAGLLAEDGRTEEAVAAFEAVAADGGVDKTLRDIATLRSAFLLVDSAGYDEIKSRVEPHAGPEQAFRNFAREILGLSAYKSGDEAAAGTWFEAIAADPQAPRNTRARADLMLALMGRSPETSSDDDGADAAVATETN